MQVASAIRLNKQELHIIYDALDRLLVSTEPGAISFLSETVADGIDFRRRAELVRARIAEHLP